jgi:hypothetical protein
MELPWRKVLIAWSCHGVFIFEGKCLKLGSYECLSKLPICRSHIVGNERPTIAGSNFEWQTLANQLSIALPFLSPVSRHRLPIGVRTFNRNSVHVARSSNIADENKIKVGITTNSESNSARPRALHSDTIQQYSTSN